ncbi:pregnancy-associated plasma protein-A-domain-containing protein [Aspergillus karnatakaensis]|uniref:zinc metalloprotease n=1 Tax=Aspergillus karnatakaensis TaxID=1810916 RepID=UPI003CCCF565
MFSPYPLMLLCLYRTASAFCGALDPSEEGIAIHRIFQAEEAALLRPRQTDGTQIEVYIHVIQDGQTEDRTIQRDLQQQMYVVNQVFTRTGFSFILSGVDNQVIANLDAVWYGNAADAQIKQYRIGNAQTVNLYVVPQIAYEYAGYASQIDDIVMARAHIPGGSAYGTNSGKVAGHEIGHWLGLFHTFQGGCDGGDYVDDTSAEASPANECPWVRDTCPETGSDPIHNHMDYTNDACRYQFTTGQINRMHSMWTGYRLMALEMGREMDPIRLPCVSEAAGAIGYHVAQAPNISSTTRALTCGVLFLNK